MTTARYGLPRVRRVLGGLGLRQTWVLGGGLVATMLDFGLALPMAVRLVVLAAIALVVATIALRVQGRSVLELAVLRAAWRANLPLERWQPHELEHRFERGQGTIPDLGVWGVRLRTLELRGARAGVLVASTGDRATVVFEVSSSRLASLALASSAQIEATVLGWRSAIEALARSGASRLVVVSWSGPLARTEALRERAVTELVGAGLDPQVAGALVAAARGGRAWLGVQAQSSRLLPGLVVAVPAILAPAGITATLLAPDELVRAQAELAHPWRTTPVLPRTVRGTWDTVVVDEEVLVRTGLVMRWPTEDQPLGWWRGLVGAVSLGANAVVATTVVVDLDTAGGLRELRAVASSAARNRIIAAQRGRVLDVEDDVVLDESRRVQAEVVAGRALARVRASVSVSVPAARYRELPSLWRGVVERAAASGLELGSLGGDAVREWATWCSLAGLVEEDPWS